MSNGNVKKGRKINVLLVEKKNNKGRGYLQEEVLKELRMYY